MKKITIILSLFLIGCATKKIQIDTGLGVIPSQRKEISHSFYLLGDSGANEAVLKAFHNSIENAGSNTTALFLGNNGYTTSSSVNRKTIFKNQLKTLIGSKSKGLFIPGSYEWSKGLKDLKKHQKQVEKQLGKHAFSPRKGCPIEKVDINEEVVVITIDSEWYLENWDKHTNINDNCEIKSRAAFFEEFEGLIKKNIGKTTIIAIHRPLFTEGVYGGKSTLLQQIYPVPVIAHAVRKTSGILTSDLQNKEYVKFKKRIVALAQHNPKVVFVSGHEQSLQYLEEDNLKQIISGSGGSKATATKNQKALFTYGENGFAKLNVYKDGSSVVDFFTIKNNKAVSVFKHEVFNEEKKEKLKKYPNNFPKKVTTQIYTSEEVKTTKSQRFFWGERYRKYYGTKVTAPTVNLDTLFGGMTPIRKGGGHQSKSLRLKSKDGREFVMRALRKSGTKYLQAVAFKDEYVEGQYDGTGVEKLILDVFTGSHPYAPFTIGTLSDAVGIYHTNPVLYYIPKQNALGKYNEDGFGDELYMIEERTTSGHENVASFGNAKKMFSTNDLYKKLRKNSRTSVDQKAYIRARLFDMLIGDWDRHGDQWRWPEFKDENGNKLYRPIPRDRDQAFSVMDDGFLLGFATTIEPTVRLLKKYSEELKSPKWMNVEPFPLDLTLTGESDEADWVAQAVYIQKNLTDEAIDKAFTFFPDEVKDKTIIEIKKKLQGRRKQLKDIAIEYYRHLNRFGIISGTDKADYFEFKRLPDGFTEIKAFHSKEEKKDDLIYAKIFNKKHTKEIWIYGLDGKDYFHVSGKGDSEIPIRIIGGQGKDRYDIEEGKRVIIYDFKSKKSIFKTKKGRHKLRDRYENNIFDHKKVENNLNTIAPLLGFNPDEGFKLGVNQTYTINGFERNPFTERHNFKAGYFFATEGFELAYNGEIANVVGGLNLGLKASFQSPNYAINFFGFGNGFINIEPENDLIDLDFNRVKIQQFKINPSLIYRGKHGGLFSFGMSYELIEPERTAGRFLELITSSNSEIFKEKSFLGGEMEYHFQNRDNEAFTTLGIETSLKAGVKTNLDESNTFGYVIPTMSIDYKLNNEGSIVLATKVKGHINIGDDFEFYQAASIGGLDGLRGFRNQRFTGKESFYQNTDVRVNLKNFKTNLIPFKFGVFGGFDYGRVWSDFDVSKKWNTSMGGGLWFDGADFFTINLGLFNSEDGNRFAFGMGFGF